MTSAISIDGQDAFTTYGIFVQNGGYANLVQWPALKPVKTNNWAEDDGIDADLTNPKLASKEFQMSFCCVDYEKTAVLFKTLTDGAYHTFDFSEIGVTKSLRLVSQPNVSTIAPLQIFSLQLADDTYLDGFTRQDLSGISLSQGYEIDGIDLSAYGVQILTGTLNNILKAPAVKKNLSIDTKINEGVFYEDSDVRFQSKDAALKCFMKSPSADVFWKNYQALLYDLVQPRERMLHVESINEYYLCYYKNSKVSKFSKGSDGSIWCQFDITLCFVSARPGQVEYFLSAENGHLIMTEKSDEDYNILIDMTGYEN